MSAAAAAGVAMTPASAADAQRFPLRVAEIGSDVSSEPVYADAAGIYARNGLDARVISFPGGGTVIDAIIGGAIDVGFSNLVSGAAAFQRGLPIVVLAPGALFTSKTPITILARAKGSKLRTGADMAGKTIAVATVRGELQIAASAWVDTHGGDAKTVKYVELPFAAMTPALAQGRVDAAVISEPFWSAGGDQIEPLGDAYGSVAPALMIGGFFAARPWVEGNRETVRRFSKAMAETARWANTHHHESAEALAKHAKIPLATLEVMRRAAYADRLSPDLIQPMLDAAVKYGSLQRPMRAAELIGAR